jgi:hypothetical protein
LSPEEYRESVTWVFQEATSYVWKMTALLALLAIILVWLWLVVVRQVSLTELANRMFAWLPAKSRPTTAPVARPVRRPVLGPARVVTAGPSLVTRLGIALAAVVLACGSVPFAVILAYLDLRARPGGVQLKAWMVSPEEARKLLSQWFAVVPSKR